MASRQAEFAPTDAQIEDFKDLYARRIEAVHTEVERLFDRLKDAERAKPQEWFAILREAKRAYREKFPHTDNRAEAEQFFNRIENRQINAVQKYAPTDLNADLMGVDIQTRRRTIKSLIDAMEVLVDDYLDELRHRPPREDSGMLGIVALGGAVAAATSKFRSRAEFYGRDQQGNVYSTVAPVIHKQSGASKYRWLRTTSQNPREKHLARVGDIYPYGASMDHPGELSKCKCGQEPIYE